MTVVQSLAWLCLRHQAARRVSPALLTLPRSQILGHSASCRSRPTQAAPTMDLVYSYDRRPKLVAQIRRMQSSTALSTQ